MSRVYDAAPERTNARVDFYERIAKKNLAPLWEVLGDLLGRGVTVQAAPHIWHYDEVRDFILEGADVISAEEAERRVLVFENPALPGEARAADTLFAGMQMIMPGEVAPAHRHSPAALRFLIEGHGAYTAINGEKAYMEPGDLVLTPSWVWHDHGHEGSEPVVWLDGLDMPLVRYLGPVFLDPYPEHRFPQGYPAGDNQARYGKNMLPIGAHFDSQNSPVFHYPFAETRAALARLAESDDLDPQHGIKLEYVNPANGGPCMPTLGCYMQLLPKGFKTAPYRSTANWIYAVAEGTGRSVVGDKTFEWGPRDTFVVPGWQPHHHEADSDAYLFSYTDRPVQEKLGLYREENGVADTA